MVVRPLAVLALVVVLLATLAPHRVAAATNTSVGVYNVQPTSFQVGWFTDAAVAGGVLVGTSCANAGTSAGEVTPNDGYVHLSAVISTVNGIPVTRSTTYYLKLVDNGVVDDNGGRCYGVTTLPDPGDSTSALVAQGSVLYPSPSCSTGAAGVLVTATVFTAQGTSWPLATMTGAGGGYSMPLGLARSTTSSGAMSIPPGSTIQLEAWAMNSDHTITSTTYTPSSDLPSMCLASMPAQVGPTATPTATARPSGFVTSTPLAIGTLTPTPSPSPSPTPTGTILAPTAIPTATPIPTNTLVPFPFPTNTTPIGPPPPPPGASSPTATATTVPTATSTAIPPPRLKGWTRIVYKVVRPDTREEVEVHTLRGVKVSMRVVYPDKLSTYSAHGTAGTAGIWRAAWSIVTLQGGTARVRFTLRLGSQIRVLNRHFRID